MSEKTIKALQEVVKYNRLAKKQDDTRINNKAKTDLIRLNSYNYASAYAPNPITGIDRIRNPTYDTPEEIENKLIAETAQNLVYQTVAEADREKTERQNEILETFNPIINLIDKRSLTREQSDILNTYPELRQAFISGQELDPEYVAERYPELYRKYPNGIRGFFKSTASVGELGAQINNLTTTFGTELTDAKNKFEVLLRSVADNLADMRASGTLTKADFDRLTRILERKALEASTSKSPEEVKEYAEDLSKATEGMAPTTPGKSLDPFGLYSSASRSREEYKGKEKSGEVFTLDEVANDQADEGEYGETTFGPDEIQGDSSLTSERGNDPELTRQELARRRQELFEKGQDAIEYINLLSSGGVLDNKYYNSLTPIEQEILKKSLIAMENEIAKGENNFNEDDLNKLLEDVSNMIGKTPASSRNTSFASEREESMILDRSMDIPDVPDVPNLNSIKNSGTSYIRKINPGKFIIGTNRIISVEDNNIVVSSGIIEYSNVVEENKLATYPYNKAVLLALKETNFDNFKAFFNSLDSKSKILLHEIYSSGITVKGTGKPTLDKRIKYVADNLPSSSPLKQSNTPSSSKKPKATKSPGTPPSKKELRKEKKTPSKSVEQDDSFFTNFNMFGEGIILAPDPKTLFNRLHVLLGSIKAGNTSKKARNETIEIADYLYKNKYIDKQDHKAILQSIM